MTVGPVVDRGRRRLRLSQTLETQSNHGQNTLFSRFSSGYSVSYCFSPCIFSFYWTPSQAILNPVSKENKNTRLDGESCNASYSTTIVNNLNFALPYIPQSSPIRNLLDFSNRNFTSFPALPLGHRWIITLPLRLRMPRPDIRP